MIKKILCGLGGILYLLLLAIFGESVIPLLLIFAILLIIGISLLLSFLFASHLEVVLEMTDLAEKQQPLQGEITITNHSLCPFPVVRAVIEIKNLFTGETSEQSVAFVVPPKGKAASDLTVTSAYCGKMVVRVKCLKVCDYFGMAALSIPKELSKEALVLPEIFPLDVTVAKSGVIEPECDTFSPYKAGNDPSETFGIRDYEPGDAMRSIHWKLTGKFDRLMIREASLPENESILILLERVCPEGRSFSSPAVRNGIGEILISLSQRLTEMNLAHSVGWVQAESGVFMEHRIDSEESFSLMMSEILSVSEIRNNEDTVESYLNSGDYDRYANVVYLGSSPIESLSLLPLMVRKTMILCTEEPDAVAAVDGEIYTVTPENCKTALYQVLI